MKHGFSKNLKKKKKSIQENMISQEIIIHNHESSHKLCNNTQYSASWKFQLKYLKAPKIIKKIYILSWRNTKMKHTAHWHATHTHLVKNFQPQYVTTMHHKDACFWQMQHHNCFAPKFSWKVSKCISFCTSQAQKAWTTPVSTHYLI